jgi:glycosyltransferase involved in cell wall biosynthesis
MWRVDAVNNALRDGYLGARANFFVSAGNRRLMETMLGVPLDNAAVVCNPFRVDYDTPFAWPEEGQMLRMACVGRLFPPAKGQDILLQTLALPNWRERPLQLTLVGQGPCESALRQLVVTLGLQEQVNFAGQVADIAEIWRTHHALVLPSRYEGMPLAVLEALLHGRPCILTAVAGHPEYITDGKNGFLADAPTVPLLAAAMERAWERRDVWEDLGRNAYQRAREQIPCDPGTVLARKLIDLLPEPEQGN